MRRTIRAWAFRVAGKAQIDGAIRRSQEPVAPQDSHDLDAGAGPRAWRHSRESSCKHAGRSVRVGCCEHRLYHNDTRQERTIKLWNESRTNRGRIADSIDFGVRSRDIWRS